MMLLEKKEQKTKKPQANKKNNASSMLTPSQDLICSFVYRENKQSSRWMQIGQHNSQLEYETASYPANVIQQNVLAHAQTSALKHHLNKTRAQGYDRRSAAACLPLSQKQK